MIYLASDHRGFVLKGKIKDWLKEWGYESEDLGAFQYDEQDDYPDYVHPAARKVSENPTEDKAIILGGSGQGEAMVANRYKGVRAAVYYGGTTDIVVISRIHNDSNILSIGAAPGANPQDTKPIDEAQLKEAIHLWLITKFTGEERHVRRIAKIDPRN